MRRFAAALLAGGLAACASDRPPALEAPELEEVVEAPQRGWLERHQSADGSWDPDPAAHPCGCLADDGPSPLGRAGMTGVALLSFLEYGVTHKSGRYASLVAKGLRWLKAAQSADGCFSGLSGPERVRDHAIAALAMTHIHAGTRSLFFREPAQRGIDFALTLRGPEGAWSDAGTGGAPNLETTVWMTLALRAGAAGGLAVDDGAFDRVRAWVDRDSALAKSSPGVALLLHHLCGAARTDPSILRGRELALRAVPRWGGPGPDSELAVAWFGSTGMFATSEGRPFPAEDAGWMAWYGGIRTLQLPELPPDDCAAGSFGRGPRRIADTALALMIEAFGYR